MQRSTFQRSASVEPVSVAGDATPEVLFFMGPHWTTGGRSGGVEGATAASESPTLPDSRVPPRSGRRHHP